MASFTSSKAAASGHVQKSSKQVMYGDLMNAICFTAFFPVYIYLWQYQSPGENGAAHTCLAFLVTTAFCWLSFWKQSPFWSSWSLAAMCVSIACMNLYKWPHNEVIVVPQFTWCLLIIAANRALTMPYRVWLAVMALANAFGIVLFLDAFDKIPLLLASSSIYGLALYYYHRIHQAGGVLVSANVASVVLAGSFAYYLSYEMMSMYADDSYTTTGGYNILRIGFFAAAGLAASGSFQQEIEFKKALEIQVEQRARQIQAQADKLLRVEGALQASETAIAITVTEQQQMEWSNAAFLRLTGQSSHQNHSFWELMQLERTDEEKLRAMFFGHTEKSCEIAVGQRFFNVEITSMENSKGLSMVVLKDITEKRARVEAEKKAERQALFAKTMNESMQTLSHELRTPLQGIMGMTSMLLDDENTGVSKEVIECLSMIMTSSRLLLTLINNILDMRKCDAGYMDQFTIGSVKLQPCFEEVKDFCRPFASVSGIDLVMDMTHAGCSVQANPLRLQQILINLISNSIKYGPSNSTVSLSSRVTSKQKIDQEIQSHALATGCETLPYEGNVVVISVRDEGSGISPRESNRLFGRFAQLHGNDRTDVAQPSGTGLGLSLCAEFVGRMRGQVWAENVESGGCIFSFYLPKSEETSTNSLPVSTPDSNLAVVNTRVLRPSKSFSASNIRILLVDDIQINLKILRRMFEKLDVGRVVTVDSGEKALGCLASETFDLVVTDLHMPVMLGTELSMAIHNDEILSKKPPVVVGLTADSGEAVEAECREAGMTMVLHKPITQHGLEDFLDHFCKAMLKS